MLVAQVTRNSRTGYANGTKITVTRRFTNKSLGHVRTRVVITDLRSGKEIVNRKTDYDDMGRGDAAYTRECRYYGLV